MRAEYFVKALSELESTFYYLLFKHLYTFAAMYGAKQTS